MLERKERKPQEKKINMCQLHNNVMGMLWHEVMEIQVEKYP